MSSGVMVRLSELAAADSAHILGLLSSALAHRGFEAQRTSQTRSWESEIDCLRDVAERLIRHDERFAGWHFLLEYEIPRRQKRPDGILLNSDLLFVIEFKIGQQRAGAAERWQVQEYALDLRDFHAASQDRTIIPLLCVENTDNEHPSGDCPSSGVVWPVRVCGASELATHIISLYGHAHTTGGRHIDAGAWQQSTYRPVLSIIEAAEELFKNHDVREISHKYADNLTEATDAIIEQVCRAQSRGDRCICFLTGVPGAGKTLTGLNAVHDPRLRAEGRPPAVFLSGNGPLVKVIRAALKRSARKEGTSAGEASRRVSAFIQNVHAFIQHSQSNGSAPPPERVLVFDEAQRAWDARKMGKKHGIEASEPELLLSIMERIEGWCVVVALVGGGQEIHEGEAGLSEWGRTLSSRPVRWLVTAPGEVLGGGQSVAGQRLFESDHTGIATVQQDDRLHLRDSTRSWRAHRFNQWVNEVLRVNPADAGGHFGDCHEFPLVRTRDLALARRWLRDRSRLEPQRRCGLVASSGAVRLRAYGIELSSAFRKGYPYDAWFLAGPSDVRSSFRLEVAATEFEVQGLELDWVGLCWGPDLSMGSSGQWEFRRFPGNQCCRVTGETTQQYMINKYRVLLTRARQGLVIWVPPGREDDRTLAREFFDGTYDYLRACGVPELLPSW